MSGAARVRVCAESALAPGHVASARLAPRDGLPAEVIVLRDGGGALRGYLNRCKHLPIPLDAGTGEFSAGDPERLVCGTHGAVYRASDGVCVSGPCRGAALDPIPLVVEGGVVYALDDLAPAGGATGPAGSA